MIWKSNDAFKHIRRIQVIALKEVNTLFAGLYRSSFKGQGLEFEDIREYQQGDDIRLMNWSVTARTRSPYINLFREERELSLLLIVDVSASSKFSHTHQLKSELIAEIASILAFSAIRNQDKVGLVLFSEEIELYLKPQKGIKHVLRVIRELLYFKPKFLGTNIQNALAFIGKVQKKRALCFLISDFLTDDFSLQLSILAKKHELIAFHLYDDYEKNFAPKALVTLRNLETQEEILVDTADKKWQKHFQEQMQAHFLSIHHLFQRAGVSYLSSDTNQSSTAILRQFFQTRKKHS